MFKLKIINKPKMIKMKCNIEFPDVVLANLQEKETTPTKETQVVVADFPFDGLSKLKVNAIPDEYIIPSGDIQITENGTYDVSSKANAIVNVPEKVLGTKTITKNGTYNATDDNLDGYSQVNVETSGVDINDYFETTYSGTSPSSWVSQNFVKKVPDLIIDDSVTSLQNFCNNIGFCPKIICNSNITNMSSMYYQNTSKNIDVSGLNTSKVTNMSYMFNQCSRLTSLDVSNFITNNVTNMSSMFRVCSSLTSLDVSNFITNNVTNMSYMFSNCSNLTSLDLSNFNTSKVTDMQQMFVSCSKLTNLDIRNFDFSNVTSYSNMFTYLPANCLIIVKDDTAKTWITSKFTTLTNVKTVAELGE